jgi:predicted dehydrogenase
MQSSRRKFLQSTAAAAAPMIVPARVLGGRRGIAPSDKIVMASIGVGSMGGGHLRGLLQIPEIRLSAICDVRQEARERAKAQVDRQYNDSKCATYNDFRELLARPDIDAVLIATPENWHPLIGIEAARRGKHMYYEKPLSTTLAEGWAVRDAIRRYGVVFQFGTQQRSSYNYRFAAELVRNGHIGQLQTIMIGSAGGAFSKEKPEEPKEPPPGFDYDMWLGPAPYRPYSDLRVSRHWMFIRDYGIGCVSGAWGIHDVDAAQFFNDSDNTAPITTEGRARYYEDIRDVPYSWTVEHKYANGVTLIHMDMLTARKRDPRFNLGGMASVVVGSKGWIWVSRDGIRTEPASLLQTIIRPDEKRVIFSNDHRRNFLDAIRTRRQPISPIEAAVQAETICQQEDIAMRLQRKLTWDPKTERFVNDDEANRLLWRAIRGPWQYTV